MTSTVDHVPDREGNPMSSPADQYNESLKKSQQAVLDAIEAWTKSAQNAFSVPTATLAGPENSLKFDGRFPHSVRDGGAWTTVNHERMPVLLTREDERRGLTGSTDEALALARGYPPTRSSSR